MKRLAIISIFLFATIGVKAQCVATPTDPCIPVHQSTLDRTSKALDELKAAQDLIASYVKQTGATDAEIAAYKNLTVIAQNTIAILQTGIADRDKLIDLQEKALDAMANLNDKLMAQLGKGKSGWDKFKETLKEIMLLAAGAAIGRGHL